MTDKTERRAKRLVMFRKLERERASLEVQNARAARDHAEDAVQRQREMVDSESDSAQASNGRSRSPEEIQLALACVEATRADLKNKLEILKNTEKTLGVKSRALLLTHQKVQQMEALKDNAAKAANTEEKKKEQAEIDDLAVNRESRR